MKYLFAILLTIAVQFIGYAQTESVSDTTQLDSLSVNIPSIDSAKVARKLKSTVSKTLADTLGNYENLIPVTADSTLSKQVKEKGKAAINQQLNNTIPTDSTAVGSKVKGLANEAVTNKMGIDMTGIPSDSAAVINRARAIGTEMLTEETGVALSTLPTDSASVKNTVSTITKSEFTNQTGIEAPDITIDSTTVDQIKEEASKRGEEAIKNTDEFKALNESDSELGQLTDMKEEIEVTREQLQQMQAKKEMKQKMAVRAKDFISEHSEELQEVQSQMTELKQKYAAVPNSNDLSTAQKRSSLKGESFWKRLVIGGNFNLTETNPVSIDFSPVLGWKFNKLFELGVTGTYRARFGADKSGINTFESEDVYGYSAYANHMAFKNFFGYIEFENISQVTGTDEDNSRDWHQNFLIGIGRKFKVAKFLEMQAIISYNFLHDNRDGVYNGPVVFKTGFRVIK